jgi:hypothetical protein
MTGPIDISGCDCVAEQKHRTNKRGTRADPESPETYVTFHRMLFSETDSAETKSTLLSRLTDVTFHLSKV